MSQLFADRYTLVRTLGRGSFGVVYRAQDTKLRDRAVALKVLHPQLSVDETALPLFEREAAMLATLRHDHIVTVYDLGIWQDQRFLVMEYIEGASLAQVVKTRGALPADTVTAWLRQAADALAHAHSRGVIHRDIKAANLLVESARNRLYVSDFGLARAAELSGGSSDSDSRKALTGTAAYRAPEVRTTGHTVASDLYSLGVVAYELLAGQRPFPGSDPLDLMMAHATDPVPLLPASVPASLSAVVLRLLAKQPEARYADGGAVMAALAGIGESGRGREREKKGEGERGSKGESATSTLRDSQSTIHNPQFNASSLAPDPELAELARRAEALEQELAAERAKAAQRAAEEEERRKAAAAAAAEMQRLSEAQRQREVEAAALKARIEAAERENRLLREAAAAVISLIDHPVLAKLGMEMVLIPAGSFLMGSNPLLDLDAWFDEQPQHSVFLDAYRISRTPVTVAQFTAFVEATGYVTTQEREKGNSEANWRQPNGVGSNISKKANHPVTWVTWEGAVAFCRWADVRLPTEAEWEKAARGVDGRLYPWGNTPPDNKRCNFGYAVKDTTPVDAYLAGASPYGVLDMAGNVWEWCSDWYDEKAYQQKDRKNPTGPASGRSRVLRGGEWESKAAFVRCAHRGWGIPIDRNVNRGFRVVSPGF